MDIKLNNHMEEKAKKKVKPPFPKIAVFNVTALILAFTGYDYEIKDMMQVLSHGTRAYYQSHSAILRGFVAAWDPKRLLQTRLLEFGDSRWSWDPGYPSDE